jgi:hypothetical protein
MNRFTKSLAVMISFGALAAINACGSTPDTQGEVEHGDVQERLRLGRRLCASSSDCRADQFCTTEIGECRRPPGCRPGDVCPAVCYGVCRRRPEPVQCGAVTCDPGQVCCNASCGICTPPGGACTQQICDPAVECLNNSDCRTFSDYCTGCDCRALATSEPDPVCPGPGVQCLIDPCFDQSAQCVQGQCVLAEQF